ncbi:MAG TPA: hypothetical protein VMM14_05930 [Acidimicrobiia bacterium]|nr:hypothetical protein [Acidimicrobiia bacterium]
MRAAPREKTSLRYWLIVLVLVALGFLTIFSVGLYFWFIAIALVLLGPFRSRPRIFLPGIALFLGFLIGYVLVAPWGCQQSFTSDLTTGEETVSPVVCTSPIGIEYSGPEPYEPTRTPALVAGGSSAVIAATLTWIVTARSTGREPDSTNQTRVWKRGPKGINRSTR